jgi:hypothetical protein
MNKDEMRQVAKDKMCSAMRRTGMNEEIIEAYLNGGEFDDVVIAIAEKLASIMQAEIDKGSFNPKGGQACTEQERRKIRKCVFGENGAERWCKAYDKTSDGTPAVIDLRGKLEGFRRLDKDETNG